MMWTNAQLKQNAWKILQRDYWMPFLVCFLCLIIASAANGLVDQVFPVLSIQDFRYSDSISRTLIGGILSMASMLSLAITFGVSCFVTNILEVGQKRPVHYIRRHGAHLVVDAAPYARGLLFVREHVRARRKSHSRYHRTGNILVLVATEHAGEQSVQRAVVNIGHIIVVIHNPRSA